MATLAELVVRLSGDSSKLVGELAKGEHGVKKFAGSAGQAVRDVGKVMLGLGVATAAGGAVVGKHLFDVGRNIDAVNQKANTVFGEMIGEMDRWAAASAGAMGLTSQELKGVGANFADLIIPMGFTRQEAVGMTKDVIGLAGALAEWSGGKRTATEVGQILAKAMLGEREQLKELGISIKEADVVARLAAKGQQELTGAALEQAKALATQELIFEKSTDAQAAFAAGGPPLLRAQNEIRAVLKQVRDDLAEDLIPVFAQAAEWLKEHVPEAADRARQALDDIRAWISDHKNDIKNFFDDVKQAAEFMFDSFVTGVQTAGPPLRSFGNWIIDNKPVLVAAILGIGAAIVIALGPVSGTVFAITGLITLLGTFRNHWRDVANSVIGSVEGMVNGIVRALNGLIGTIDGFVTGTLNPFAKVLDMFGQGPGRLEWNVLPRIPELTIPRVGEDGGSQQGGGGVLSGLFENLNRLIPAIRGAAAAAGDLGGDGGGALGGVAGALGAAKKTTEELTEAEKALAASRASLFDTIKQIQGDFLSEQIDAYLKGGQEAVGVVKDQQQEMLAAARSIALDLRQTFGIDLPDALEIAMSHLKKSADDVATHARAAQQEMAKALGNNAQSAFEQFGAEGLEAGAFGFNLSGLKVGGTSVGVGGVAGSLQEAFDSVARSVTSRGGVLSPTDMAAIVRSLEAQQAARHGVLVGEASPGTTVNITIPAINVEGDVTSDGDLSRKVQQAVRDGIEGGGFRDLIVSPA